MLKERHLESHKLVEGFVEDLIAKSLQAQNSLIHSLNKEVSKKSLIEKMNVDGKDVRKNPEFLQRGA